MVYYQTLMGVNKMNRYLREAETLSMFIRYCIRVESSTDYKTAQIAFAARMNAMKTRRAIIALLLMEG